MVERENKNIPEKDPTTVPEVSQKIRGFFERTSSDAPEELYVWKSALYDIIGLRQQQFNVLMARERWGKSRTEEDERRLSEESFFLAYKDRRILRKLEEDDTYNGVFEKLSHEVYAMEAIYIREKNKNFAGATTRELKRIKKHIQDM